MLARKVALIALFLLACFGTGAGAAEPIVLDDVMRLLEAGVSERVIIAQIEASGVAFELTTDQILSLQEEGVPESVIEAMILAGPGGEAEGYVDVEDEAERSEVPADLGFDRYDKPASVEVALVPYAVPQVAYVYDPWYSDYFWYDPWYYVSWSYPYRYGYYGCFYPYYHSGLYVSFHYGHRYYPNYYNHHHGYYGYHDQYYVSNHDGRRSYSATRPTYGKSTYRGRSTSQLVSAGRSEYRTRERYSRGTSIDRGSSGYTRTPTTRKATRAAPAPAVDRTSRGGTKASPSPSPTYRSGGRAGTGRSSSPAPTRSYGGSSSSRSGGGKAAPSPTRSSGSGSGKARR